jgi:hypothetical protein
MKRGMWGSVGDGLGEVDLGGVDLGAWWMDMKKSRRSLNPWWGKRAIAGWVGLGVGLGGQLAIDWSKDLGAVPWSILKNGPSGFEVGFIFFG